MGHTRMLFGLAVAIAALLSTPALALANNDNVGNAQQIGYGVAHAVTTDVSTYSTETGEAHTFGVAASGCGTLMTRTAWYTVTATGGPLVFATLGSSVQPITTSPPNDTVLVVYTGSPGSLTEVGCNDDFGGARTSQVSLTAATGTQLFIQAGLFCFDATNCPSAVARTGTLKLTATNASGPANDDRASPAALNPGPEVSANNSLASVEPGEPTTCTTTNGAHPSFGATVWFKYHAPSVGSATFRTNVSGTVDTVLAVYAGGATTPLGCNDDGVIVGASSLSLALNPGDYFVQVGAYGPFTTKQGTFGVDVDFTPNHDVDGDGSLAIPFGGDCNDHDPRIHPGAFDIPGDGIDQNCDGHDADFPPVGANASMSVLFFKKFTRVHKLGVTGIPSGSTVRLTCTSKKKGCRVKSKTLHPTKKTLSLLKYMKKSKLKKNAVVEVRVTKPGFIGAVFRFTIRIGDVAKKRTLCLRPGAKTPAHC